MRASASNDSPWVKDTRHLSINSDRSSGWIAAIQSAALTSLEDIPVYWSHRWLQSSTPPSGKALHTNPGIVSITVRSRSPSCKSSERSVNAVRSFRLRFGEIASPLLLAWRRCFICPLQLPWCLASLPSWHDSKRFWWNLSTPKKQVPAWKSRALWGSASCRILVHKWTASGAHRLSRVEKFYSNHCIEIIWRNSSSSLRGLSTPRASIETYRAWILTRAGNPRPYEGQVHAE